MAPQRERVRLRLQRFVDGQVERRSGAVAPPRPGRAAARTSRAAAPADRGAGRGAQRRRRQSGPTVARGLKALGVRAGRFALFLPALLKPRARQCGPCCGRLQHGLAVPGLPRRTLVSLPHRQTGRRVLPRRMGWLEAGPVLLRLDVAERVAAELAWATRRGAAALPAGLASRFAVKAELLPAVLRRLGFRLVPASGLAADEFGPPAPAMILPLRRRRPAVVTARQADRTDLRRVGGAQALGRSDTRAGRPGLAAAGQVAVVRPLHAGAQRLRRPGGRGSSASTGSRPTRRTPACASATC